jgi:SPOR domain
MRLKIRKLVWISTFLILAGATNCLGQTNNIYKQDSLVKILVKRHIALSQARKTMPGYRVQIFFGHDRKNALDVKSEFRKMFNDTPTYMTYQQPNFKIRVGDFRNRFEALKFLNEIQILYSSAFLVKDAVKLPEL